MYDRRNGLDAPPAYGDVEQAQRAKLLKAISTVILAAFLFGGASVPLTTASPVAPMISAAIGVLVQIGVLFLVRHGRVRTASTVQSCSLWIVVTAGSAIFGGIVSPILSGYSIVVVVAGLLSGKRAGMRFALASIAGATCILIAGVLPGLPWRPAEVTPVSAWVSEVAILGTAGVLIYFSIGNLNSALARAQANERAQACGNRELSRLRMSLEQRVADLEQTQRLLHDSEQLYHDLVQEIPQSVFRKDLAGCFTFGNRRFCEDMGKPFAEIVGKTDFDLNPRGLAEQYHLDDLSVCSSGERVDTIVEHRLSSGPLRYLQVIKTPTFDSSGRQSGIQGIYWDITEQVQSASALRKSRDEMEALVHVRAAELAQERSLLKTLLDNLPGAAYVKDAECRFVMANAAQARLVGAAAPEEIIGQTALDLLPPSRAMQQIADERRVLDLGVSVVGREDVYDDRVTGQRMWNLTTLVPLNDVAGTRIGLVGIAHDITQRMRAEASLRESENRLRTIVEGTRALLVSVDVRGRITYANQAAARAMGYSSPDLLVGKFYMHYLRREDRKRVLAAHIQQIKARQHSVSLEMQVMDALGQVKWFSFLSDLVMCGDRVVGMNGVAQDITEHKLNEQETLRQNNELATLNRVGRELSRLAQPSRIVELLGDAVGHILDSRNFYIALCDQESRRVSFPLCLVDGQRRPGDVGRSLGNGLTEHVLRSRAPVLINGDVAQKGRRLGFSEHGRPAKSLLAVPIVAGDKAIGVIAVQDYDHDQTYGARHLELLSAIAWQAAVAFENARLFGAVKQELQERKRAEETLARERNLLRTLIDNIPDSIFAKDLSGRYILVNQEHARSVGASDPDQVVGKTDYDLIAQNLAAFFAAEDQKVLQTGRALINREMRGTKHMTGKPAWGLTTKVPLRDRSGRIAGLVCLNRDITKLKQVEETLRLQAAHLEIAAQVARTVTSILDLDAILPRVVDLVREQFGYYQTSVFLVDPPGECAALRALSVDGREHDPLPDIRIRVGEAGMVGYVLQAGRTRVAQNVSAEGLFRAEPLLPETRSEIAVPLKVGDVVIGALDVQSRIVNGFSDEAVSIIATIADQLAVAIQNARLHGAEKQRSKELEQAYRAVQENQARLLAAEKMASLGRLTAGIAHEINTPLAAVRAALVEIEHLTNEIRSSVGDPLVTPQDYVEITDDMRHAVDIALRASERAAGFVHSIKSQTRDMSASQALLFNPVPVIDEVLLLLRHAIRKAGCSIRFEHPEVKMEIFGLPGRLGQVVTNLVANAVEASSPLGGGPVTVRFETEGDGYRLMVADRGSGIPQDILDKIFDPMFTTKPFGEGTGLGLAIVHDIVTGDFRGSIRVTTQIGQGTTFSVSLPSFKDLPHAAQVQ